MNKNQKPTSDFEEMDINSDAEIPGSTHLTNAHEEENEQAKLEEKLNEEKDKYIRLLAEFENFKKRTIKERAEFFQTAGKDVIISLLDILDDIDRAEDQAKNEDGNNSLTEGTRLIFSKLQKSLQAKGLTAMESIGEPFDEAKHDAIQIIDAGKDNSNIVVNETQKGYYLNDKIIRHAKVIVGK